MATTRQLLPRGSWIVAAIFALQCAAQIDCAEPRRPAGPRPKEVGTTGGMRIKVLDSAGQPVAKTPIHVAVWTDEDFPHNQDYACDADGRVEIKLPKTLTILRIWASRDGHVPLFAHWWPEHQANGFPIPEEFTFRLAKGSVIGGVVKNADGQPIAGAKVEVRHVGRADDMTERPVISTWLANGDGGRVTDADGRWSLDNVPADEEAQVRLKISHPDYIDDQSWGEMQQKQHVTMEQLRAKTAVVVMQRGINVTGMVTAADGKPVAGAVVVFGDRPYFQEGSQEVRTDQGGGYRFPPLPPGAMTVTVVAEGWAPQLRKIDIKPENPPVNFELTRGKTLRLRFVDRAGTPIPKVGIGIAKWRGGESLYNYKHPNVLDTKIPVYADENGVYEWTWAPDDAVTYHISLPAKAPPPPTTISLTADGAEQMLTLPLQLLVTGKASDAETGEAIGEFTAVPVLELPNGRLLVERSRAKRAAGRYFFQMENGSAAYRVRIEAAGYRSAVSEASFRAGDANLTCDVELQKAPPAAGRIVDADGKPLERSLVILSTATQPLFLVQRHEGGQDAATFGNHAHSHLTNSNGEFWFPAQYEPYFVMVKTGFGYAECVHQPDEPPGELVLREFARVEGRLFDGGKPMVGAEVLIQPLRLHSRGMPKLDERYLTLTDHDGRYAFDRVPPLKCMLSFARRPSGAGRFATREFVPLDLQPGETVTLDRTAAGAEVLGRVRLKGAGADKVDLSHSLNYLLHRTDGIKPLLQVALRRFDWKKGWDDAWLATAEGVSYLQTLHHCRVELNRDGTFRLGGVPAGEYELAFKIYKRKTDGTVSPAGLKVVKFSVADEKSGRGRVDLGEIEIKPMSDSELGEPASEFEIELLDAVTRQRSP